MHVLPKDMVPRVRSSGSPHSFRLSTGWVRWKKNHRTHEASGALKWPGAPPLARRRQLRLLATSVSRQRGERQEGWEEEEEMRVASVGTGLRRHELHPSQSYQPTCSFLFQAAFLHLLQKRLQYLLYTTTRVFRRTSGRRSTSISKQPLRGLGALQYWSTSSRCVPCASDADQNQLL